MPTNLPNGLMERTACEDESVVDGSVIVPEHPVGKTVRSRRVTLPLRNCAVKTYLRSLVRLVWLGGGRCSRVFRDARPAAAGQELLSLSFHRSPGWSRSDLSRKHSQRCQFGSGSRTHQARRQSSDSGHFPHPRAAQNAAVGEVERRGNKSSARVGGWRRDLAGE